MSELQAIIESAWERRAELSSEEVDTRLRFSVNAVLADLESGVRRVA